jgi:hypothetical protein
VTKRARMIFVLENVPGILHRFGKMEPGRVRFGQGSKPEIARIAPPNRALVPAGVPPRNWESNDQDPSPGVNWQCLPSPSPGRGVDPSNQSRCWCHEWRQALPPFAMKASQRATRAAASQAATAPFVSPCLPRCPSTHGLLFQPQSAPAPT